MYFFPDDKFYEVHNERFSLVPFKCECAGRGEHVACGVFKEEGLKDPGLVLS